MQELSSAIIRNYGGDRVFSTYQTEDQTNVNLYLALAIVAYTETTNAVNFTVKANWSHNAYENSVPFEFGYYWYTEGDSSTRHTVSVEIGAFNTPNNLENWEMTRTFSVPKDTTKRKIILPFFKIGGVQYPSQDPWGLPWINVYGSLWIRTDRIVSAYNSSFVYGGVTATAARVVAGPTASSTSYDNGIVIPASTPSPVSIAKPDGTFVKATNIYVYDASGAPRRALKITVYGADGSPHIMNC